MSFSMWERRLDSEPRKEAFSLGLVLTPCLGGVSVAPSPPLSHPQHPPSLSLNHSDPAHLELVCFSILSSTVVISNQPICVSLSPQQQPTFLLISARSGRREHQSAWKRDKDVALVIWDVFVFIYIHYLHSADSHTCTLDRHHKHKQQTQCNQKHKLFTFCKEGCGSSVCSGPDWEKEGSRIEIWKVVVK